MPNRQAPKLIRFTKRVRRGLAILATRGAMADYLNNMIDREDFHASDAEIDDASLAHDWIYQELKRRGE